MLQQKEQKSPTWSSLAYQEIAKIWKNGINQTDLQRTLWRIFLQKSVDLGKRLRKSKDKFLFNLVFDLWYIVVAFSMFDCLFGEVVSYLFYSKQPTEVNWWIHPNYIFPQGTKRRVEKRDSSTGVFLWILRSF